MDLPEIYPVVRRSVPKPMLASFDQPKWPPEPNFDIEEFRIVSRDPPMYEKV